MQNQNNLGFAEVVDTLADGLEITEQIHTALADGIGITDIGTLISIAPKAAEIRRDAAQFRAEFEDLTPEEALLVKSSLQARVGNSDDRIVEKALDAVGLSAEWYAFVDKGVELTTRTVAFGKNLFRKAA